MPDRCSPASAASTSASTEPASPSPGNARSTRGDEPCSPTTGPPSGAPKTYAKSRRAGFNDPSPESWKESATAPTLDAAGHGPRTATLICSAEGSPAKTSQSPDDAPAWTDNAPACSSSTPGSQLSLLLHGSSLRTSQGFSPLPTAATLRSFSQHWPTSGTASPGGYLTLATSESPNAAVECSLQDVLEVTPSPRYRLSSRAATGILRRAAARGRTLPPELEQALRSLARSHDATAKASTPPPTTEPSLSDPCAIPATAEPDSTPSRPPGETLW